MRIKTIFAIVLGFLIVLATGCGSSRAGKAAFESQVSSDSSTNAQFNTTSQEQAQAEMKMEIAYAAETEIVPRQIIKNADLELGVGDIAGTASQVERLVDQAGGIIAESRISNFERQGSRAGFLRLRVPNQKFEDFLKSLEELGEVKDRRTYTENVTEQYIDLEVRLNNFLEQESRLRQLVAQADTVDEILKIEKELTRVRGESEALAGKLRYLKNQVDYATINLNLVYTGVISREVEVLDKNRVWQQGLGAFNASINGLSKFISMLFILLFAALPVAVPGLAVGVLVIVYRRKKANKLKEGQ